MGRQGNTAWVWAVVASGLLGATPRVEALDLVFPAPAEVTASRSESAATQRLPTGPFADGALPTIVQEGSVALRAFRLPLDGASTLDLMRGLRTQLEAAGHEILFDCETDACGGFDFRYGMDVLPEPDMHVSLGDFRYLLARKAGGHVAVMVSRAGETAFVQITEVGTETAMAVPKPAPLPRAVAEPAPPPASGLIARIEAGEAEVLEDLVFSSGSSVLAEGDYASLSLLAAWLTADPARKIVLVGHTDASGGLEENINLSRLRAESVRQVLLSSKNVRPEQVLAEGVGYLSPRVSNLTEEGRQKNRRVEVMVTSTALLAP